MQMIIHTAVYEISLAMCGDDGINRPCSAPESNQADSGQVRLLQPAIIHTTQHI